MTEPTVRRFRRRPVEVEAVQVQGDDTGDTARAIAAWCHGDLSGLYRDPKVILDHVDSAGRHHTTVARAGDWIIRLGCDRYQVVHDHDMRADHEEADPT
ncbi:hypothetical protein ACFRCG_39755 [Embleya sp. NPDC056575]|uniref:hypothetical protein n=1 Tax=unclassified Embleya TaxID=2699296 RepID=UPI00368C7D35